MPVSVRYIVDDVDVAIPFYTEMLDFTLGSYTVRTERGAVLGRSEIALDPTLSRCLIEESIDGPAGYRATGWLYYDSIEDRFYRTVVDNQGRRIELRGGVSAGGFAMEGADPFDPGSALRLSWTFCGGWKPPGLSPGMSTHRRCRRWCRTRSRSLRESCAPRWRQ